MSIDSNNVRRNHIVKGNYPGPACDSCKLLTVHSLKTGENFCVNMDCHKSTHYKKDSPSFRVYKMRNNPPVV